MTDHSDVPLMATGDWIDAAWINQYLGDNVRAWRQAYTQKARSLTRWIATPWLSLPRQGP